MKLSVYSFREYGGFVVVVSTLTPYVCCGASFAQRLDDHTCGGGSALVKQATPLGRGLKQGLHPPLGERLERPHELQPAHLAWCLLPKRRLSLWTERIIAEKEEPATRPITSGWGFFGRVA